MIQVATVTSKRQLTIPADVFKKAKLSEGDKVVVEERHGELRIKKTKAMVSQLAGSVSVPKKLLTHDTDKAIKLAKEKRFGRRK